MRDARWPDKDIDSTFAMLSIHKVRAPNHFPTRNATKPGKAPELITTAGRSRSTTHATWAAI